MREDDVVHKQDPAQSYRGLLDLVLTKKYLTAVTAGLYMLTYTYVRYVIGHTLHDTYVIRALFFYFFSAPISFNLIMLIHQPN